MSRGESAGLAERVFGVASLAFPARLRLEIGDEMRQAFRCALIRRRADAGGRAAVVFAARSVMDVIRAGLGARWRTRDRVARNDMRRGDGMGGELWQDVKHGARRLRRAPGFAVMAAGLLAVGIGANTAVFSALKAALLAPPPFAEPDRLAWLSLEIGPTESEAEPFPWSWPKFEILAAGADAVLGSVSGYGVRSVTVSGAASDPARLAVEVVGPAYFETLRITPAPGRAFEAGEEVENGPVAVVLAHGVWQERYGGDASLVGRTVTLNGRPAQVVGIAPPGFEGLSGSAGAWLPVSAAAQIISPVMVRAQAHWMHAFGRLAEGVALESVPARLGGVATSIRETYPMEGLDGHTAVAAVRLADVRSNATSRTALLVLMGAAAMVLLISCANLAGLLLARGRSRARDAAIRLSLGAGRARVVRAGLMEALLLAVTGGTLGLVVAWWGLAGLRSIWPSRFLQSGARTAVGLPLEALEIELFRLDAVALGFAFGATVLTALLFGILPALRQARVPVERALRDGSGSTRRREGRRGLPGATSLLVAGQTALALVLLVGTALMLRTLVELSSVSAGFDPDDVVVMDVTVPRSSTAAENPLVLREAILGRVASLAPVQAAALGCAPLSGWCSIAGVRGLDGREVELEAPIGIHGVSDAFFSTLRVPVRAGRTFGPEDHATSPPVVVLNETAARTLYGRADPIGRTVALTMDLTSDGRQAEVIGVVGDVLQGDPTEGRRAEAYFTERQFAEDITLMVRTRGEPLEAVAPIRGAIRDVAPEVVVDGVRTMQDVRRRATGETRTVLLLLGIFAATAVVLAGAGIWAIVALTVAERGRELGLRMALGARASQIVGMVVRHGMAAALGGAAVGAWAAWALARLLSGLLFNTDVHEPMAFIGAALVLLLGAAVASLVPARHATRVDPARALRAD